jgi:hypothetical protein
MKPYIDEGHVDAPKRYSEKKAIKVIKSLLKDDDDLLNGRDVESISDDDILEIGFYYYEIYKD